MAPLNADLVKAGSPMGGAARRVVGKDPAGELVEPALLRLSAQLREQGATQAVAAAVGVHVDGVLPDAPVDAAVRVGAGARPAQDATGPLGHHERPPVA